MVISLEDASRDAWADARASPCEELPVPTAELLAAHRGGAGHGFSDSASVDIRAQSESNDLGRLWLRVVQAQDLAAMDEPRMRMERFSSAGEGSSTRSATARRRSSSSTASPCAILFARSGSSRSVRACRRGKEAPLRLGSDFWIY